MTEEQIAEIFKTKVGDTIWYKMPTYANRPFKDQWVPCIITKETRNYWIINPWTKKCPKKKNPSIHREWAFSLEELQELEWMDTMPNKIKNAVYDTPAVGLSKEDWMQIAKIIGFSRK